MSMTHGGCEDEIGGWVRCPGRSIVSASQHRDGPWGTPTGLQRCLDTRDGTVLCMAVDPLPVGAVMGFRRDGLDNLADRNALLPRL